MKRKTRLFLQLADQLDQELERSTEIYLTTHPYIEDQTMGFIDRTEEQIKEKVENDMVVWELIKRLQELI